ncbi:MAG: hypothetical protein LBM01_03550, partial [Christensenellaceae bacterium]|nr:hypothetical protein [Christensenellaceae bacterium]
RNPTDLKKEVELVHFFHFTKNLGGNFLLSKQYFSTAWREMVHFFFFRVYYRAKFSVCQD